MTPLPFAIRLRQLLAAAALLLAACGEPTAESSLAAARAKLAANDFSAAVIEAKNALQRDPQLGEARYLLGLALLRGGDPAGGEAELTKALALGHAAEIVEPALAQSLLAQRQYRRLIDQYAELQPAPPSALSSLKTTLAAAYFLLGENELAQAALAAALQADPGNSPALMLQARSQAAQGDQAAAIAGLDALLARAPADAAVWKLKGDLLATAPGQAAMALAAYRKAAELAPGDVAVQSEVLAMLLRQGQLDDASRQSERLVKLAPNNPRVRYLEALLAYDRKDFKTARTLAQQLLVLAPANPGHLLLAGDIELALGAPAQAELHLEQALKIAPQSLLARRLLVTSYLRSKQSAKAVATLQPLLEGAAPDSATLALAAEVYRQSGDTKKAAALLAKATQLDPGNQRALSAQALNHLASGGGDAALAELRRIAAANADVTADLALIGAHIVRQEFEPALKAIDALEKKQPGQPLAANLRGRALLARRDLAGARASFERALAITPGYFAAVDGLAAVDLAEGQPQAARQRFEALLAKNPKNVQVLVALATLRMAVGGAQEALKADVTTLLQRAVAAAPGDKRPRLAMVDFHLRNRDGALALAAARDAVAAVPDSPDLLDALGRAQQATGDLNQAIVSYTKLAALQPRSPGPQMRLAGAHLAAKDKPSAAASLRRALAIQPNLLDAQRGLVTLAVESKDFEEARDIARKVQQQRPAEVVGYLFEGEIAAGLKQWDKAFDAYQRGLRQLPTTDLARRAHAALGAAGKTSQRDRFAIDWLKDHPKDALFHLYLGDVSAAQRDFATAERHYASATRLQPGSGVAYNNLAWVSGQLRRSGATAMAEKAVALAPDQPAFMDTLAQLLVQEKRYAKALEWQQKAVSLQPQHGAFRLNLARIQILAGEKDLARKELNSLAALGDKFRGQADVARLLKSL